jgi:hypothetical protein
VLPGSAAGLDYLAWEIDDLVKSATNPDGIAASTRETRE